MTSDPSPHPIVAARIEAQRAKGRRNLSGSVLLHRKDREALGISTDDWSRDSTFCRWCGTSPVPVGRRTWCSEQCITAYRVRAEPGYVRLLLHRRDKAVCAACGIDTDEMRRLYKEALAAFKAEHQMHHYVEGADGYKLRHDTPEWTAFQEEWGIWHRTHPNSFWEADHIVPVVEGGGICGLDNYRTLCVQCHRHETKHLAGRRAVKRRKSAGIPEQLPLLAEQEISPESRKKLDFWPIMCYNVVTATHQHKGAASK